MKVIPDADAHMDSHPVFTYNYTLYKVLPATASDEKVEIDVLLIADKRKHPNYLGTIFFDRPNKGFNYASDDIVGLSGDQVQEIIERITLYRTNLALWRV